MVFCVTTDQSGAVSERRDAARQSGTETAPRWPPSELLTRAEQWVRGGTQHGRAVPRRPPGGLRVNYWPERGCECGGQWEEGRSEAERYRDGPLMASEWTTDQSGAVSERRDAARQSGTETAPWWPPSELLTRAGLWVRGGTQRGRAVPRQPPDGLRVNYWPERGCEWEEGRSEAERYRDGPLMASEWTTDQSGAVSERRDAARQSGTETAPWWPPSELLTRARLWVRGRTQRGRAVPRRPPGGLRVNYWPERGCEWEEGRSEAERYWDGPPVASEWTTDQSGAVSERRDAARQSGTETAPWWPPSELLTRAGLWVRGGTQRGRAVPRRPPGGVRVNYWPERGCERGGQTGGTQRGRAVLRRPPGGLRVNYWPERGCEWEEGRSEAERYRDGPLMASEWTTDQSGAASERKDAARQSGTETAPRWPPSELLTRAGLWVRGGTQHGRAVPRRPPGGLRVNYWPERGCECGGQWEEGRSEAERYRDGPLMASEWTTDQSGAVSERRDAARQSGTETAPWWPPSELLTRAGLWVRGGTQRGRAVPRRPPDGLRVNYWPERGCEWEEGRSEAERYRDGPLVASEWTTDQSGAVSERKDAARQSGTETAPRWPPSELLTRAGLWVRGGTQHGRAVPRRPPGGLRVNYWPERGCERGGQWEEGRSEAERYWDGPPVASEWTTDQSGAVSERRDAARQSGTETAPWWPPSELLTRAGLWVRGGTQRGRAVPRRPPGGVRVNYWPERGCERGGQTGGTQRGRAVLRRPPGGLRVNYWPERGCEWEEGRSEAERYRDGPLMASEWTTDQSGAVSERRDAARQSGTETAPWWPPSELLTRAGLWVRGGTQRGRAGPRRPPGGLRVNYWPERGCEWEEGRSAAERYRDGPLVPSEWTTDQSGAVSERDAARQSGTETAPWWRPSELLTRAGLWARRPVRGGTQRGRAVPRRPPGGRCPPHPSPRSSRSDSRADWSSCRENLQRDVKASTIALTIGLVPHRTVF